MAFSIDIREEAGVRSLHFGSEWVQGAMRIARPWNLELDYTREMMAGLLLRDSDKYPRNVLLIGLGAASLTKFLYRHYPLAQLTVVEIKPDVVTAARQFFKLPEDPSRLNIIIGDGAEYVENCHQRYDLVLVDGFDENARTGRLNTTPFYQSVRGLLSDDGIMAVNLLGSSRGFAASVGRIRSAFDERAITFPPCDSGNTIAFATQGEPIHIALVDLKEAALTLKASTSLSLLGTLTRLEKAQTCTGGILRL